MPSFLNLEPQMLEEFMLEEPDSSELDIVEDWAGNNGLMSSNKEVTKAFEDYVLPDALAGLPKDYLVNLILQNRNFDEIRYRFNDYVDDLVRSDLLHEEQAKSYTYGGE